MTAFTELTKEELAIRLGMSVRQVDYLVSRAELPAGRRKGRRLVWHEVVVDGWKRREYAEQLAWAERI